MSACNSNGNLSKVASTVSFDTATGLATFSNLTISNIGMYLILISVQTVNSADYNFQCISTPVIVKSSSDVISTAAATSEPDMYLTFSGNYSSKSTDELKQFQAMIYNCILAKYGLLMQSSIVLYAGSIKAVISTTGTSTGYSNLVSDLNSSNFSLASDVTLQSAIISGTNFTFDKSSSSSSGGTTSSDTEKTNAVNFKKKLYSTLTGSLRLQYQILKTNQKFVRQCF